MLAPTIRIGLTAVMAIAALTQIAGFGHWRREFEALGGEPWARVLTGVILLAGLALYWWPGRRGYGAAVLGGVAAAALVAHLAVLGVSSAPPALALALMAGWEARRNRADFRR